MTNAVKQGYKTHSYVEELAILLFGHVELYKILNYQDLK